MEDSEANILMLAYFRQVYQGRVETTPEGVTVVPLTDKDVRVEALHLAWSRDGLHWTPMNGNRALPLDTTGHGTIRDPFIGRGPDGRFHLVSTGGAGHRDMLTAHSADLIHWDGPQSVPLMRAVPEVRNVWAPEWVFDEDAGQYFVFWSSSNGQHGWDDSRIWCARTPDFRSFSEPRVLFDPGYTVIDATIVRHGGAFTMFFKDERFGHRHGEHRFILAATAESLDGPYTVVTEALTPCLTEGPAVFQAPGSDAWLMVYDHCMDNRYGASVSNDLLLWETVAEADFPPNARHASVFRVTGAELSALRARFG